MTAMKVPASRAQSDAIEIQRIIAAADAANSAKQRQIVVTRSAAEKELRCVVQAANDRGLSLQAIGDALGVRRGAACQRFRRGSDTRLPSNLCLTSEPARGTNTR